MSGIHEFVMAHPLFCHHDHHDDFETFDANRKAYSFASLLYHAETDLITSAGTRPPAVPIQKRDISRLCPTSEPPATARP